MVLAPLPLPIGRVLWWRWRFINQSPPPPSTANGGIRTPAGNGCFARRIKCHLSLATMRRRCSRLCHKRHRQPRKPRARSMAPPSAGKCWGGQTSPVVSHSSPLPPTHSPQPRCRPPARLTASPSTARRNIVVASTTLLGDTNTWTNTQGMSISGTAANVTGTVAVATGGTGITSVADGSLLFGSPAAPLPSRLSPPLRSAASSPRHTPPVVLSGVPPQP